VGHNLAFDLQKAALLKALRGRSSYELHDTQGLAHLDDEHREAGLKKLMVSVLGWEDVIEVEIKSGPNKGQMKKVPREKHEMETVRRKMKLTVNDPWSLLPRAVILPYAVKDAQATLELYTKLRPQVERYEDLWQLYQQEMELMLVLYDMAAAGLDLDLPYVEAQIREYGKRVARHELAIEQIVGKPVRTGKIPPKEKDLFFNPNSNPQLREYFEARGFERDSYDEANLNEIDDPLARALPSLRADSKILNTYFVAMKREQRDGILHPNFRQHGTVTGRMSSGKQEG
jgi:DNA polymerase I-like protein with 3'-5' exonuclease and polymerase domains